MFKRKKYDFFSRECLCYYTIQTVKHKGADPALQMNSMLCKFSKFVIYQQMHLHQNKGIFCLAIHHSLSL